jgi:hypothetical protein
MRRREEREIPRFARNDGCFVAGQTSEVFIAIVFLFTALDSRMYLVEMRRRRAFLLTTLE